MLRDIEFWLSLVRTIPIRLTIPMLKQVLLTLILLRSIEAIKAFDLIELFKNFSF
jgi:ABC-type sugar transport system permease subunit